MENAAVITLQKRVNSLDREIDNEQYEIRNKILSLHESQVKLDQLIQEFTSLNQTLEKLKQEGDAQ